jgi:hypothetical protein
LCPQKKSASALALVEVAVVVVVLVVAEVVAVVAVVVAVCERVTGPQVEVEDTCPLLLWAASNCIGGGRGALVVVSSSPPIYFHHLLTHPCTNAPPENCIMRSMEAGIDAHVQR